MRDLEETDLAIGEIALNHGFPNSKAFSNLFRKRYGMLPNQYRKTVTSEKNGSPHITYRIKAAVYF